MPDTAISGKDKGYRNFIDSVKRYFFFLFLISLLISCFSLLFSHFSHLTSPSTVYASESCQTSIWRSASCGSQSNWCLWNTNCDSGWVSSPQYTVNCGTNQVVVNTGTYCKDDSTGLKRFQGYSTCEQDSKCPQPIPTPIPTQIPTPTLSHTCTTSTWESTQTGSQPNWCNKDTFCETDWLDSPQRTIYCNNDEIVVNTGTFCKRTDNKKKFTGTSACERIYSVSPTNVPTNTPTPTTKPEQKSCHAVPKDLDFRYFPVGGWWILNWFSDGGEWPHDGGLSGVKVTSGGDNSFGKCEFDLRGQAGTEIVPNKSQYAVDSRNVFCNCNNVGLIAYHKPNEAFPNTCPYIESNELKVNFGDCPCARADYNNNDEIDDWDYQYFINNSQVCRDCTPTTCAWDQLGCGRFDLNKDNIVNWEDMEFVGFHCKGVKFCWCWKPEPISAITSSLEIEPKQTVFSSLIDKIKDIFDIKRRLSPFYELL